MKSTQQQTYQWTGMNPRGERIQGEMQVADVKEIQTELKKIGVELISVGEKKSLFSFKKKSIRKGKIKAKDILFFTRYLSTMLAAGLPLVQALDIMGRDQSNPAMQSMIGSIKNSISGGKTLAESFSEYPKVFSDLYCNLIKAGEKSGTLDKTLKRLSHYLERSDNLKRKLKKAMIYPIAILTVSFIVGLILLLFVVPQFDTMFKSFGAKLPLFTQMVVNVSHFLRSYGCIVLVLSIPGFWFGKRVYKNSEYLKEMVAKWSLKIMIIGPILKKGIIARFTRTLATTLEAGMPIVESMKTMAPIMGNRIYTRGILQICDDVTNGHALSVSINATKLFPNMVIQMISVGEASGALSDMLNRIADYYEGEVNDIVDNLSTLLEPLIMVILGGVIGTFIVAMYLPIFKIGSLF